MKKSYILCFEGQQHHAIAATGDDHTQVKVGEGNLKEVDYWPVLGGRAISLRIGGKMHLVQITGLDNKGKVMATMDGHPIPMTVMDELKAQALESLGTSDGGGIIAADIPGLVVEIKVQAGQAVNPGDPVIVVEAMKMQNELCATVAGTVTGIRVKEGQAVNPGDTLVIIEPVPEG